MKHNILFILTLAILIQAAAVTYAASSTDDIIIPSAGVRAGTGDKPEIWIGAPNNSLNQKQSGYNNPFQSQMDDTTDRIYVEPKQKTKSVKEWMNSKPEGVNFHLQQPSIKVGG